MSKMQRYIWLGLALTLTTGYAMAADKLGRIEPGSYPMRAITNHLPWSYKNYKVYWEALQKVELELGNQERFRDLPQLSLKQPFTGTIVLGDGQQQFGVIIDLVGEEKRLYIDRDGDGSFQGETWLPLLNEWYGLQIYEVYGPEPFTVQVTYKDGSKHQLALQIMSSLLNRPGAQFKEKPFLKVAVTSWFLSRINEDGGKKLVAVIDRNNNGCFNDPEDYLYFDYNDDGRFDEKEWLQRKRGVTLPNKQKLTADWSVYPDVLVIGGKK